jgi:hypothetical protein
MCATATAELEGKAVISCVYHAETMGVIFKYDCVVTPCAIM